MTIYIIKRGVNCYIKKRLKSIQKNNKGGFYGYTGSYVDTTTIGADGAILAMFSDNAHKQLRGKTVTFTPEEVEETGNLKWNCLSSVASKYLPNSCTNDGSSGNPTDRNLK